MNCEQILANKFNLPKQDLAKLSFCGAGSAKLKQWLESLSVTHTTETSIILYQTLPEICRLKTPADKRITMLEALYSHVHQCIEGSMRELLRQPLMLSPQMMKLAVITQALQRHLNDGYMIAVNQLLQAKKGAVRQQLLALCLYRAISGLGLLLLRSYQFYTPQPTSGLWYKLHTLYQLAVEQQLDKVAVTDPLLNSQGKMTAGAAYKRSLLLACSSPYQLRQMDMTHLFQAFEQCASMVQLVAAKEDSRKSLYWVSLLHDKGPFYSNRLRGEPVEGIQAVNLDTLIRSLESLRESGDKNRNYIHFPIPFSHVLVSHLLRNWKKANIRLIERHSSNQPLEVYVGLTAVHDQLLEHDSFEALLRKSRPQGADRENILESFNNEWEIEERPATRVSATKKNDAPLTVNTINSSNSGYCLVWDQGITEKVRVGELLSMRESTQHSWQIGMICWAQRHKDKVYTGVRLFSAKVEAYAASTILRDGSNSPYFRALLLTDSSQDEADSIITPSIPFEVNQIAFLQRYEDRMKIYLQSLLLTSTTVSQFTYRSINLESDDAK